MNNNKVYPHKISNSLTFQGFPILSTYIILNHQANLPFCQEINSS